MKAFRIFRNHYLCDACPNEWETCLLTTGRDWCPCCDKEAEPYLSDEFEETSHEFADEDEEVA